MVDIYLEAFIMTEYWNAKKQSIPVTGRHIF